MMFINHSCEPNLGMGGNVALVAIRDIAPGEELTGDYAMFDDSDSMMDCRCGTASCRGTITGKHWTRPKLQERHRGRFSWWLQQKIDA